MSQTSNADSLVDSKLSVPNEAEGIMTDSPSDREVANNERTTTRRSRVITVVYVGYLALLATFLVIKPLDVLPPGSTLGALFRSLRPVGHILGFTPLGLLAVAGQVPLRAWANVAFLVAFAVGTEFVHYLLPRRTPDVMDSLQNLIGIALGVLIYWAVSRKTDT